MKARAHDDVPEQLSEKVAVTFVLFLSKSVHHSSEFNQVFVEEAHEFPTFCFDDDALDLISDIGKLFGVFSIQFVKEISIDVQIVGEIGREVLKGRVLFCFYSLRSEGGWQMNPEADKFLFGKQGFQVVDVSKKGEARVIAVAVGALPHAAGTQMKLCAVELNLKIAEPCIVIKMMPVQEPN